MKKVLIILFCFIASLAEAANYHFATAGNDITGNGSITTPYQTITKLNALWAAGTLAPGDSVVFKAGDTFTGTITVTESGTLANRIIVGRYWTGADPIITGFTTLASWTSEGGSLYSKTIALASTEYLIVSVDGTNTPIGRYPNTGAAWLTVDSYSGQTSITDAAIPKATQDWTGADIVIRLQNWALERRTISNHTGTTLTYSAASYAATVGGGYYIEKHLATLNATNEWFYDGTDFFIYGNPAAKTVKVSAYTNAVVINSFDYITFDNINFTGYGGDGFSLTDASYITIQNCAISFCGESGIRGVDEGSGNSGYCLIDGNTISSINNNGVYLEGQFDNVTVSNNSLSDIGIISGAAHNLEYGYVYEGIHTNFDLINATIEYNILDDIGYNGIAFYGTNTNVNHNFINNFCKILQDGGGIYTYRDSYAPTNTGIVRKNIVLNGIGNFDGLTEPYKYAMGIYTDGANSGIRIDSNSIANMEGNGYNSNGNANGIFRKNTILNCENQILLSKFTTSYDCHANMLIKQNVFFCKYVASWSFYYSCGTYGDMVASVSIDSNYYCRPLDDDYVFRYYKSPSLYEYTLATWQTFRGDDAESAKTLISIADSSDIDFYYNATNAPVVKTLPYASVDITGTKYATEYTVPAWSSVVLMKDPDVDPDPPDPPIVTTSLVVQSGNGSALGGGNVTDDGDGTVSARGLCWNTTGSPTTSDDKTTDGTGTGVFTSTMIGLARNTTYYIRAYATNEVATAYGYQVTYSTYGRSGFINGKTGFIDGKRAVIY